MFVNKNPAFRHFMSLDGMNSIFFHLINTFFHFWLWWLDFAGKI